ncbi:MAG: UvrD-helicase domain-containing protein [Flaviramulus sp.]|nr:UvrD-helicase domain-containing protein [Flaviramulus sp.]NNC49179.1 UvrD-helicase domain-containing protein [Flaviramulus sp.]
MQNNYPFTVYNASAGSGKTFTLVKEYLKILFTSNNQYHFKNILAITFTNKAVAEMKDRIINMLKQFSDPTILENPHGMFNILCEELEIKPLILHEKSKKLLSKIIHNYAAFDISTIDGFTHKLIRTFAHDLRLPLNFEVELDQDVLLNEAVDRLIAKAGTDAVLTKVLIDFAIEKADDDKSWDVSFDFNVVAKLLVNENHVPFIEKLQSKTLKDFQDLKTQLKNNISSLEINIAEKAQSVLTLIEQAGLEHTDFLGGSKCYLPKYFLKLKKLNLDINFTTAWISNLEEKPLYPIKTASENIKEILDNIQPELVSVFNETKKDVFQLKFLKNFYKNITPLSVLSAINSELNTLKEEQNKMLISEFNSIICNEIKNQPTPFIYERIGEKFKHYFIDEFQDTSIMQWENLIPLLRNSLSSENGSAMLVGDAKQAIYRWRGGKAEQFIDLFNKKNTPFPVTQEVNSLNANYRSLKEVVEFNNGFFKFLSTQVFNKEEYAELYQAAHQDITKKENGYVELSFLDIEKEDDRDEIFPNHVLQTINNCLDNQYELKDICVLVRKNKEGVAIADLLSQNQIPIVSSETLLIANSPEVCFINDFLTLLIQPKNNEIKISVLNYLTSLFNIEDKHDFFTKRLPLSIEKLVKSFELYQVFLDSHFLLQMPLYDLAETIVRSFKLVNTSNAYIQFYLDIVLDFSQKKGSDISKFLAYFEKKKEKLSIVSPKGQNAVQIMTIHKSKGLEFPVVIFPYADLDIYKEQQPKEWFELDEVKYSGFTHTLLNYNKDFENYGELGQGIYNNHQSELELDNINLFYVTLTRAVEQLYVISSKEISTKGDAKTNKYSGLLISYLQYLGLWNDSELIYKFGNIKKFQENTETSDEISIHQEFISTSKEELNISVVTKSGYLWDTNQQEAIEKGNLLHNIMSKINTKNDIDNAINDFIKSSLVNVEQSTALKQLVYKIVEHPKLLRYYSANNSIYNERDIITKTGIVLRPDRVVVNSENEAVIIDYKTGIEDKKHEQQLQLYQDVLEDMKIDVKKKILIYLNDDILVKDI